MDLLTEPARSKIEKKVGAVYNKPKYKFKRVEREIPVQWILERRNLKRSTSPGDSS